MGSIGGTWGIWLPQVEVLPPDPVGECLEVAGAQVCRGDHNTAHVDVAVGLATEQ